MMGHRDAAVSGHRFALGHTVSLVVPNVAAGAYTIIGLLPARDGEFQYRVRSEREPYDRVVKEDDLAG